MKKILNEAKADAIAIYNALDIASGGNLSLIQQSIARTFQGFLEAKFNNLVLDVLSNDVNEEELLGFINSQSERNKEFISNLILKNLHADNRITTFLLAKLWVQKMRNGSLNYYESSLFSNINTLTFEDFKIFFDVLQNIHTYSVENVFESATSNENEFYVTSLTKFENFGIIRNADLIGGNFVIEENILRIRFHKTPYSETFLKYLQEYFESN
ncbi:MAG: hypothetical protein AB7U26_04995 [Sulfuricurvum sp.]